jgi:hypothetical protein
MDFDNFYTPKYSVHQICVKERTEFFQYFVEYAKETSLELHQSKTAAITLLGEFDIGIIFAYC